MKPLEIIRIALTNLRSNGARSMLTIAGISVGIGAIVFLVSLGYGLQKMSTEKIASIDAINTIDVSPGKEGTKDLNQATVDEINAWEEVEKTSPFLSMGGKVSVGQNQTDTVINAVESSFFKMEGTEITYGAVFTDNAKYTVISSGLVKAIGQNANDIVSQEINFNVIMPGDNEKIEKFELVVSGVIQDDSSAFSVVPLNLVKDNLSEDSNYNSLKVNVSDQEQIQGVKDRLGGMGFKVSSIADTIDQVNQIFRVLQIVLAMFGMVALLVAAIGMFNTMTIALLERTRDIGIMKSVGVRNKDVYSMFLVESIFIATSGGVAGVVVGYLISKGANFLINRLALSVGGEVQTLFHTPLWFVSVVIGFSIIVGISTGFYPSRRAARLNPLDALRYE